MIRITSDHGVYEVDTDAQPSRWLSDCPRTEVEGVVFLSFIQVLNYDRDGGASAGPVALRLAAIESVQVDR